MTSGAGNCDQRDWPLDKDPHRAQGLRCLHSLFSIKSVASCQISTSQLPFPEAVGVQEMQAGVWEWAADFPAAEWVFVWLQPSGQHSLLLHDIPLGTVFIFSQRLSQVFFSRTVTAPEQESYYCKNFAETKKILDKWEIINLDQPRLARVTNVTFLQRCAVHPSARSKC